MTATETLTLADFLLARIAEDEAATVGHVDNYVQRQRAECEAKRRIVEMHRYAPRHVGTTALNHLAAIYADHPDYRQEWKPWALRHT